MIEKEQNTQDPFFSMTQEAKLTSLLARLKEVAMEFMEEGKLCSEEERFKTLEEAHQKQIKELQSQLNLTKDALLLSQSAVVDQSVAISELQEMKGELQSANHKADSLSLQLSHFKQDEQRKIESAVEDCRLKCMNARVEQVLVVDKENRDLRQSNMDLKKKLSEVEQELQKYEEEANLKGNSKKLGNIAEDQLHEWLNNHVSSFCEIERKTHVANACDFWIRTKTDGIKIMIDVKRFASTASLPAKDKQKFQSDIRSQQPDGAILYSNIPIESSEKSKIVEVVQEGPIFVAYVSIHSEPTLWHAIMELLIQIRVHRTLQSGEVQPEIKGKDELIDCMRGLFEYNKFLFQQNEKIIGLHDFLKDSLAEHWSKALQKYKAALQKCPEVAKPTFREYFDKQKPSGHWINAYTKRAAEIAETENSFISLSNSSSSSASASASIELDVPSSSSRGSKKVKK